MFRRCAALAALLPWLIAAAPLEREAFVAEVLEVNPAVEAARQGVLAALARETRVAWADPELAWSVAPGTFGAGEVGQVFEVRQGVPLSGRVALERAAARARHAAAEEDVAGVRVALALAAATLFDEYWLSAEALDLNAAHQARVAELEEAVRAAYAAGRAPQADAIQAEMEAARLDRERLSLLAARDVAVARMNGLLHRPPLAALPPPAPPPAPAPPLALEGATAPPEAAALAARTEAVLLTERAAKRSWVPDLMVMGRYSSMWMEPSHRWMVGVGVQIPLQQGPRRGAVAEARAEAEQLEARRAHVLHEAHAAAAAARREAQAAAEAWRLYHDRLLPLARRRVEATRAAFEGGLSAFSDVVEAERALLEVELGAARAVATFHTRRAAWEAAAGRVPGETP